MHGLPGQTAEMAMADLQQGIALATSHLSWYQLTIEPNTEFHSRPPLLPEDEQLWAIQDQGQALLDRSGFSQYEISAYSHPGQQCRHNLNYWRFGDYIGIGAGAHGKLTDLKQQQLIRRWKQRQPKAYQTHPRQSQVQVLSSDDLALEFMMNGLRLNQGVEASLFESRTGLALIQIQPQLDRARQLGLLEQESSWLTPTPHGRRFLNDLLELFV